MVFIAPGEGFPFIPAGRVVRAGTDEPWQKAVPMAQVSRIKRVEDMNTLQRELDRATANLPTLFLQKLIDKKLKKQGIEPPRGFSEKMAAHFLAKHPEPFTFESRKLPKNIKLTFTKTDADEIAKAMEDFCTTKLPKILPDVARKTARSVLKTLRERWPGEHALQEEDLNRFREGLQQRWGPSIGQLRMLLTMSREWCQEALQRVESRKQPSPEKMRKILIRLLVRACQVTDEIACLLENGFADGAMARWRTLHEIAIVAAVISQHGDSIAERYLAHQFVESKRAMDKYLACYKQLGYKPLTLTAGNGANDSLVAGEGVDVLTGGTGNDKFFALDGLALGSFVTGNASSSNTLIAEGDISGADLSHIGALQIGDGGAGDVTIIASQLTGIGTIDTPSGALSTLALAGDGTYDFSGKTIAGGLTSTPPPTPATPRRTPPPSPSAPPPSIPTQAPPPSTSSPPETAITP